MTPSTTTDTVSADQQPPLATPPSFLPLPLTIAISGPTSSGKTTLAYILRAILQPFNAPTASSSNAPPIPIIHQDAFFHPKSLCPRVRFTSTPHDTSYIESTICNIQRTETRLDKVAGWEPAEDYKTKVWEGQRWDIGRYTIVWKGHMPGGRASPPGIYEIDGPDTDGVGSVDWKAMGNCVRGVIGIGSAESEPTSLEDVWHAWENDGVPGEENTKHWEVDWAEREEARKMKEGGGAAAVEEEYAELIALMQARVKQFIMQTDWSRELPPGEKLPKMPGYKISRKIRADYGDGPPSLNRCITIVEGFRLYPPAPDVASSAPSSIQASLCDIYDVKLFLALSQDHVRARRFSRPAFVDVEVGGLRRPGEVWKTTGYFEDVAWRQYCEDRTWEAEGVVVAAGARTVKELAGFAVSVVLKAWSEGLER